MFPEIKNVLKSRLLVGVTIVSLLFNILVILPYVKPYYNKFEKKLFPPEHFTIQTPDKEVLNKVCEATLQAMGGVKMPMNENKGLPEDLKAFFTPQRNSSISYNYYTAYGYVGLSYYAIANKDSILMNKLREKAKTMYTPNNGTLSYDFIRIDQTPIGLFFLNLYYWFQDKEYKNVADNIFLQVLDWRNENGIIMYFNNSEVQFSDVLGMYIPFLMEYFNVTGDTFAYEIAEYNMKLYYEKAVDKETGIPVHGYNTVSGIKVGSANWGRGIGWYLLAAAFCPQIDDQTLKKTLLVADYTQFPGCSEHYDTSTALMFEIYKQSKDKRRKISLDFIKPHILTSGFVDDCSGDTYGLNNYSHTFGESELCNGLLLMLVSKFDNQYQTYSSDCGEGAL